MTIGSFLSKCIVIAQRKLCGGYGGWGEGPGVFRNAPMSMLAHDACGEDAQRLIYELLESSAPCMIARFGAYEMEVVSRTYDKTRSGGCLSKTLDMLTGNGGPFWFNKINREVMSLNTGFFPATDEQLVRFGERMLEDARQVDLLGGWLAGERRLHDKFFPQGKTVPLRDLEPFPYANPWTRALAGRKVLVIHPFAATIEQQFKRREKLFRNPDMCPAFELWTFPSVVSFAGEKPPFPTWFDALDYICEGISKIDFEVALIGAGAYGFPLAAFIKRELKRKAVHLGGVTQLLFGIKGKRWDDDPFFRDEVYNEFWVRPSSTERPKHLGKIEGGCYW